MSMVMRGRAAAGVPVVPAAPVVAVVAVVPAPPAAPADAGELAEVEAGSVGTWAWGLAAADEQAARASTDMVNTLLATSGMR
jgi:hypothetical protein